MCLKCGKPIEDDEAEYCVDCIRIKKHFIKGFPAFSYEDPVKKSLYNFKYKNQRQYAVFYAQSIMERYGEELRKLCFSGIVPVPVYKRKRRIRGYNQALLLANELGKALGVKVFPDYLVRIIDTNPQKELNDAQRMKNIKKAFKIGVNEVKLNRILLVDDIYTSGATVEACTQELLRSGTGSVYYTSVAIGRGYAQTNSGGM